MQNYFKDCQTLEEAKKLYKKLALKLHPDKGGKTADFQELLNQFENFKPTTEKFKGEAENFDAKSYSQLINDLINIPNIDVVICGSWLWIEGDTKPVKEQIKAVQLPEDMKRGFSKSKLQWYFSPKGYKKKSKKSLSIDEIKNLYGATKVRGKYTKQLN